MPRTTASARRTDPVSSHLAANVIEATGTAHSQRERVLEAVHDFRRHTSAELARLAEMDRYQVARRLPELAAAQLVRRSTVRRCEVSGRPAVTWEPAP